MKEELTQILKEDVSHFLEEQVNPSIEYPPDLSHGDYATNIALVVGAKTGRKPYEIAQEIVKKLRERKVPFIEKIVVAGPGFINFYLSSDFSAKTVEAILEGGDAYGRNETEAGKKIIIEYTDPNPFKEFHIGHLMSNAIGESLSCLLLWSGAEVKRANYQGDIGLHVAKALWALLKQNNSSVSAELLGEMYSEGASAYEEDAKAKEEIVAINKKLYEGKDKDLLKIYKEGRQVSLDAFEKIYTRLGTKFDYYFFESETGEIGRDIVLKHVGPTFEESDGAIVFHGEKYGLHTRVFITKEGYPTYEAKELGLAKTKWELYPYDLSFVVTANEVKEYFKVLLKAMEQVFPDLAMRTHHISHGVLRLPSGKMASRKGNVITAGELLNQARNIIMPKIEENETLTKDEREKLAELVAVGAVKYSILKHALGGDIIFDFGTSLSFEGDSAPYLQYTYARACSVLRKAEERKINPSLKRGSLDDEDVQKLLHRFPEIIKHAQREYAPQYIATYLIELSRSFNNFYAREKIVDEGSNASYRLALTKAVSIILKNGLHLLGIQAPEKM